MNQRWFFGAAKVILVLVSYGAVARAAAVDDEAATIQAFLNLRYLPADVVYSFQTKFGEDIDCIEYLKQPGAKALAAAGSPLTLVPPTQPPPVKAFGDIAFDGTSSDTMGHRRACPNGTVPLLRITVDDVRARGGLDSYIRANSQKNASAAVVSPGSPTVPGFGPSQGYSHVIEQYNGPNTLAGGTSTLTVWSPSPIFLAAGNHSIAQNWLLGPGSNGQQTVEWGWTADYGINGDNDPHFFIYSTSDGYAHGHYNTSIGHASGPIFLIQPGAFLTPGMKLSSGSTPNGFHTAIQTVLTFSSASGALGWEIWGVGVYPYQYYNSAMRTGTAQTFQVGGEVFDITHSWVFPMGSAAAPNANEFGAASAYGLEALRSDNVWDLSFSTPIFDNSSEYGAVTSSGPINGTAGAGFYFGDLPKVWWQHDYGSSPIGDWSPGNSKGQCPLGIPMIGISNSPSTPNSHAILCDQLVIPVQSTSCNTRLFAGGDNRGYLDSGWDWDPGFLKAECQPNEFVQGVAQDSSGQFLGALCCPSTLLHITHLSCQVQTFESGDSVGQNGLPDWDPGFPKGRCPHGWVVEGASAGASGRVRSILCCT